MLLCSITYVHRYYWQAYYIVKQCLCSAEHRILVHLERLVKLDLDLYCVFSIRGKNIKIAGLFSLFFKFINVNTKYPGSPAIPGTRLTSTRVRVLEYLFQPYWRVIKMLMMWKYYVFTRLQQRAVSIWWYDTKCGLKNSVALVVLKSSLTCKKCE